MKKEDFDKLKYQKIIIDDNKAKILFDDYLIIITEFENEKDIVYTMFKDKEFILADHKPLDELIENLNKFIKESGKL